MDCFKRHIKALQITGFFTYLSQVNLKLVYFVGDGDVCILIGYLRVPSGALAATWAIVIMKLVKLHT